MNQDCFKCQDFYNGYSEGFKTGTYHGYMSLFFLSSGLMNLVMSNISNSAPEESLKCIRDYLQKANVEINKLLKEKLKVNLEEKKS